MPKLHQTAALLMLAAFCVQGSALRGAERPSGVAKLFDAGTKNTPTAAAAARAQYEQLKKANPKDARVEYAYGLALANQRRSREALPLVSRYVQSVPNDLAARRVRIWVQVQDKQYVKALDDCVAVARAFPKDMPDDPEQLVETARFLGTIFGYLELARPGAVDAEGSLARKNEVLAALGEECLKAFDEGRQAVATQVDELEAQRDAQRKQVAAAAEQAKKKIQTVLEEDKKKAEEHSDAMQTNAARVNNSNRELGLLQTQFQRLQRDQTRLLAEIAKTQAELQYLTTPKNRTTTVDRRRPGDTSPPEVTTTTKTEPIPLHQLAKANEVAMRLALLNRQAIDVDRRMMAFQARADEVSTDQNRARFELGEGQEMVRQIEQHAKGTEQRLRRAIPTSTARATALAAKMTSFTTYAPFPYEEETQRVLSWFAK